MDTEEETLVDLFQVRNYIVLVRIPVEHQVNFAVALLRGSALSWRRITILDQEKSPRDLYAF
jgi:hypothetical protein